MLTMAEDFEIAFASLLWRRGRRTETPEVRIVSLRQVERAAEDIEYSFNRLLTSDCLRCARKGRLLHVENGTWSVSPSHLEKTFLVTRILNEHDGTWPCCCSPSGRKEEIMSGDPRLAEAAAEEAAQDGLFIEGDACEDAGAYEEWIGRHIQELIDADYEGGWHQVYPEINLSGEIVGLVGADEDGYVVVDWRGRNPTAFDGACDAVMSREAFLDGVQRGLAYRE